MFYRNTAGEVVDVPEDEYSVGKEVTARWLKETPEGQEFVANYSTDANIDKMHQQIEFHNSDVTFSSLSFAFTALRDSGQLPTEEQEEAAKQAAVPRTRAGVPMNAAQLRWQEYREFSERSSMQQVRERMRTDAGFASFVHKQYEREFQQVQDGATPSDGAYKPSSARLRL